MSGRRRLIEDGWRSYAEHVLPTHAPKVQTQETRRTFYAGVQHAMGLFWDIGDDIVSEDEGVRRLESIRDELQTFVLDVMKGKR